MSALKINCPDCGHKFEAEKIITEEVMMTLRDQVEKELQLREDGLLKKKRDLEAREKKLQERLHQEDEIIRKKLKDAREAVREELKKKFEDHYKDLLKQQEKELEERTRKLQSLQASELEVAKLKRQLAEVRSDLQLEMEKKLLKERTELEQKVRRSVTEKLELQLKEKDKQLAEQRSLITEMKRKADQGSMKTQGQAQELAIHEWLTREFPLDSITEIRSGMRGGDCLQTIHTRERENCGTIYYESKRTKEFQPGWIQKFKADIQQKNADIGVLVTQAMPKDMPRMGTKSGIWICTFEEFKGLVVALRYQIIQISRIRASRENQGEKMELLYRYLTSNEFRMHIEGIVEGFTQMQSDLLKEKNAMARIWNQREKQLEKVLLNTSQLYGSIKGIAGKAIQQIPHFELPGPDDSEDYPNVFDLSKESSSG